MLTVFNNPYIFENFDWEKAKADFHKSNQILD